MPETRQNATCKGLRYLLPRPVKRVRAVCLTTVTAPGARAEAQSPPVAVNANDTGKRTRFLKKYASCWRAGRVRRPTCATRRRQAAPCQDSEPGSTRILTVFCLFPVTRRDNRYGGGALSISRRTVVRALAADHGQRTPSWPLAAADASAGRDRSSPYRTGDRNTRGESEGTARPNMHDPMAASEADLRILKGGARSACTVGSERR